MIFQATLTCPQCGFKKLETMPEHTCQSVYVCPSCDTRIKAKEGECCVYCSYADYPCPLAQIAASSCCGLD